MFGNELNQTTTLQLTEVLIFGMSATGINVALDKTVDMSEAWDATSPAERAIDGNVMPDMAVQSFARTRYNNFCFHSPKDRFF